MLRQCPACVRRRQNVIDPDCVICQGAGTLEMGEAALQSYSPEVVAEAILLTLEAKARAGDQGLTLSDDRLHGIRAGLIELQDAGILSNTRGISPRLSPALLADRAAARPALRLASRVVQEQLDGLDAILANATPHEYTEEDRPGGRGLPLLSRDGHPSHLARLTDPADPQGDTRDQVRQRRADRRRATVLSRAASAAARERNPGQTTLEQLEFFTPDDVILGQDLAA